VILVHPSELARRGLAEGDAVDVTSHFAGETRRLERFRARAYDVPRGCAVAYFPEANALVAVGDHDRRSFTPGFKSIVVTLARAAG
jgi:anaerobic selenocysteine-containing dehydrogenase